MLKASAGLTAAALLLSGCQFSPVATGETRNESRSVDIGRAQSARVEIRMGAGELRAKSGTSRLLEADFTYNVAGWKPQVDYREGSSVGELTILQPENSGTAFGNAVYKWDLTLNDHLPLHIDAHLGAGEANLEFGRMTLRSVKVNMGVGEMRLDLRGEPKSDYKVEVQGGVGKATIYLPKGVGIAARASGAIGEIGATGLEKRDGIWINPEGMNAPVTVHLDVQGGVGEIRLIR